MLCADRRTEQQVKPVRVAVFHLTELLLILALRNFLLLKLLHQSRIADGQHLKCVAVAVLVHLLVELHVLLRVHHVVEAVARALGDGDRAGIVDAQRRVGLGFLRGDDNHAIGGLRAVDGRCRGILQHGDGLDVIGVEPRDGVAGRLQHVVHVA